jgi:hypothetical protein
MRNQLWFKSRQRLMNSIVASATGDSTGGHPALKDRAKFRPPLRLRISCTSNLNPPMTNEDCQMTNDPDLTRKLSFLSRRGFLEALPRAIR